MHTHLGKAIEVSLDALYLDANNPRLGRDDGPGYDDLAALFDPQTQDTLEGHLKEVYKTDELTEALIGQGWMPIDNIIVWQPPKETERYIVVEGNTRLLTLREIRRKLLPDAQARLARLTKNKSALAAADVKAAKTLVDQLQRLISDTNVLQVVPLQAKNSEELDERLPRVLAVRHITGSRGWGNYAQDLWMLQRYTHLYERKHGKDAALAWDDGVIQQVGHEASLTKLVTKRRLRAAAAFSHFRAGFEHLLPPDADGDPTAFVPEDYYLFELLVRSTRTSQDFEFTDATMHIPEDKEQVLFDWVFKLPRGRSADDNDNVFFRHENVRLWDQMRSYDAKHGTHYADRFDVSNPDQAPTMASVEAEYLSHKTAQRPQDILESLIKQLQGLTAAELHQQAAFLKPQLDEMMLWGQWVLNTMPAEQ